MSLPPARERDAIHTRRYEFNGFRRKDGLWDIEGHMTDTKTYGFENDFRGTIEPGEPIHDMWIRLTLDDEFKIHDIEAVTDQGPYAVCPAIAPNFKRVIGLTVGAGWRRKVREAVGGVEGCTHLTEMLGAMATAAFQTIYPVLVRERRELTKAQGKSENEGEDWDGKGASHRPVLLDSCHAFRADGPLAKAYWPAHYTGPDDPA